MHFDMAAGMCRKLLNICSRSQERSLYTVSYKRNSPGRMRTVTPENQYQRLLESVTPLSKFPYSIQLEIKRATLNRALKKVVNIIKHNRPGKWTDHMENMASDHEGCICPLADMKPSPKTEGFRNKEELNINMGADGDPNTVGLIIGRGSEFLCVPCDGLSNSKSLHIAVTKTFKSFLAQSKFRKRAEESNRPPNYWTKLMIRSNEQGHVMLVPELSCREITEEVIEQAREELTTFYCDGTHVSHGVQSLYLRVRYRSSRIYHCQRHLYGDTHIYEEVLGYRFRISPEAFFQLNTPGAEVLYTEVQQLVSACCSQTLLDIGCGTGTIGILMSPLVKTVIGVDVVPQAVEDATFNASLNGVSNAHFIMGSARSTLKKRLMDDRPLAEETVAVVNPNRNGLNKKAIQYLRCSESIKHLIFISCKPHGNALINFVDLIVAEDEDHPGQPFQAVKAIGVDMFPHTVHSELVLLFER